MTTRKSLINSRTSTKFIKQKLNMKIRKIGKFKETPDIGYGCMGLSEMNCSLYGDLYDQPVR